MSSSLSVSLHMKVELVGLVHGSLLPHVPVCNHALMQILQSPDLMVLLQCCLQLVNLLLIKVIDIVALFRHLGWRKE